MFVCNMRVVVGIVAVLTLFSWEIAEGEVVHVVGLSVNHRQPDIQRRVEFQCYLSTIDSNATVGFGRYIPTRLNETGPPRAIEYSKNRSRMKVVKFKTRAQRRMAYGVFFCHAFKIGRDPTTVLSFFIRSDAKFEPDEDTFTRTVNVGDRNVDISWLVVRSSDISGSTIHWRLNGSKPIEMLENQTRYIISGPVSRADAGIYEVYYDGERQLARGGLFRLIVRGCPHGRWRPPECEKVCDKCYNGGVCDEHSGLCICPNGFYGPNCLRICNYGGGNRFGKNCEFRCSYSMDSKYQCRGALICLPDPFGCSCDVGSKGLSCSVACFNGEFGAGCTEKCHCASGQCGIYTGECLGDPSGCSLGWSGENCQIPDICEAGYYGPECTVKCHCLNKAQCDKDTGECSNEMCDVNYATYDGSPECQSCKGNTFGYNCSHVCHCYAEACNPRTGECAGRCFDNWLPPDCSRGVVTLHTNYPKVNPGQPSSFVCHVTGKPSPDPESVHLYSDMHRGNTTGFTGIVRRNSTSWGSEVEVVFDVESVKQGEIFSCILAEGGNVAIKLVESQTYVLPIISHAPIVTNISRNDVTLEWGAWDPNVDTGDVPLVGYKIFYQTDGVGEWTELVNGSSEMAELNADTDYRFAVAAVREGPDGTGPAGPSASATTLCGPPKIHGFQLTAVPGGSPQQLKVSWKKPSTSEARCRTGFTNVTVYCIHNASGDCEVYEMTFAGPSFFKLKGLETFTEYVLYMTAANKDSESEASDAIVARTAEEAPPSPESVVVMDTTSSSVTLSWRAGNQTNLNGLIRAHEISYRRTQPHPERIGGRQVVETGESEVTYWLKGLRHGSNYSIQVRIINGAGAGYWSFPVTASTLTILDQNAANQVDGHHGDAVGINVTSSLGHRPALRGLIPGTIGGAIGSFVVALIFVFLLYRNRRKKRASPSEPVVTLSDLEENEVRRLSGDDVINMKNSNDEEGASNAEPVNNES